MQTEITSEWIFLQDRHPETADLVLGCDWYPDHEEANNFRVHVCEGPADDAYWCGEKTGEKMLLVANSVAPAIGYGLSAYWMSFPVKEDKRWIPFDIENPPVWKNKYHEVLIHLRNGNYFVASFDGVYWIPSFNQFKSGYNESIAEYMELPNAPLFIAPPKLTEEEELAKRRQSEAWSNQLRMRYGKT